jgi:flagellar assembly factor FliW
MELKTSRFGTIVVDEREIYAFERGIPGFEDHKAFVIVSPEEDEPFSFLQSVSDPDLAFIMIDPFLFYRHYEFELPDNVAQELKITTPEQVVVRAIVTIRDKLESSTINLVAPIIINAEARLGRQVVLDKSAYTTRHPLFAAERNR